MSKRPDHGPPPPACPDYHGRRITEVPAESRLPWLCEDCGRTFNADPPHQQ